MHTVVLVQPGVAAVGDVELQAVAFHVVQHDGPDPLAEVGVAEGKGSGRWVAWRRRTGTDKQPNKAIYCTLIVPL